MLSRRPLRAISPLLARGQQRQVLPLGLQRPQAPKCPHCPQQQQQQQQCSPLADCSHDSSSKSYRATFATTTSSKNAGQQNEKPNNKKKAKKKKKQKPKSKYEASVNLPKTEFPMRASAATREVESVDALTSQLYNWQRETRKEGAEDFILHDGPPYANGDLHTGHFLNKSLKDFINRYQLMRGKRIHYVPGWDTHGLPIELKALQLAGEQARPSLDARTIRSNAQSCAEQTMDKQRQGIIRWGLMGDWARQSDGWYSTMDKSYEGHQINVFRQMVKRGLVFRGLKPVYWSYSSGTALAEAEIEYSDDHVSPSCFVDLTVRKLSDAAAAQLQSAGSGSLHEQAIHLTIWTTTPWTLPSNVAVCVHAELEYALLADNANPTAPLRVIAKDIVERESLPELSKMYPEGYTIVGCVPGAALEGTTYLSPLVSDYFDDSDEAETTAKLPKGLYSVLCGAHVSLDAGTGLVHTAPMHGQDDAMVWQEYGHELLDCPLVVDSKGCFNMHEDKARFLPSHVRAKLHEVHIHQGGNEAVLELLQDFGRLAVPSTSYAHRYPYDWRTKKPVIIMATDQWFVNLATLKHDAKKALEPVDLVPASSRPRLASMLQGRDQWCISRQRYWGVPIPALFPLESSDGEPWLDEYVVQAAQEAISENGSDWWFLSPEVEASISTRANALRVQAGLTERSGHWVRGTDTLDVWFDSGCSWSAVLPEGAQADVYLEGSDQHRGWFQSSLLTRVAATSGENDAGEPMEPTAPFRHIVTHGFILDEHGRKMSKSLGNIIEPGDVIREFGADVLRFWVASTNFVDDVAISPELIRESSDNLRRVRNVMRFLLGNLFDFSPSTSSSATVTIPEDLKEHLEPIDLYMLDRTYHFVEASRTAYDEFRFRSVFSEIVRFTNADVSALYSASVKDRLYNAAADSPSRKACQWVSFEVLQALTLVSAPILAFTAQDLFKFALQEVGPFRGAPTDAFAVHQIPFPDLPAGWVLDDVARQRFDTVLALRQQVNRSLDVLRSQGSIRSSEEAELFVTLRSDAPSDLVSFASTLEAVLLLAKCEVSQASEQSAGLDAASNLEVLDTVPVPDDVSDVAELRLVRTSKTRCERCRRHTAPTEDELCPRCATIVPEPL
ncbi:Isoleucine--tRNA ligase [Hondaea fermentalgiana]|uniref:isoleucine--tRNA ligase n=1 Tax=Hondaea fermentalgiana TaxID=2315210 RepID=A0A2R5GBI3_9STRA|nr:Isoleucine--tRNA ligase [Hondaea fermentalgiana]|eukprot:GBG27935.1 Isoleucine--tRNA ligase [Hondaea fermentalgiana]